MFQPDYETFARNGRVSKSERKLTPMSGPNAGAFFLIFIAAFVIMPILVVRYRRLELRHQERLIAMEKGAVLPPEPPEAVPTIETYQLRGLVWLAAGIGISLMLFIMLPFIANRNPNDVSMRESQLKQLDYSKEEIREAMVHEDQRWESQRQRSRGLAALGLPPIAVGIAYLVFYQQQKRRQQLANPST
jgi:hypothetical protein